MCDGVSVRWNFATVAGVGRYMCPKIPRSDQVCILCNLAIWERWRATNKLHFVFRPDSYN